MHHYFTNNNKMTTLDTIELLYQAFQQNPTRLSYSTKTLCKQFAAEEGDVKLAKRLYRLNPNDFIVAQALDTDLVYDSIPASDLFETLTGEKSFIKKAEKQAFEVQRDLLEKSLYGNDEWEVKQKWVKGPEGSQLMVKKDSVKQDINYKEEYEHFINKYEIKFPTFKEPFSNRSKLAVVCMFDMHLGKIAFKSHTGVIDNQELQKDYEHEFEKLLTFVETQKPERILLPIGNDLFNVDDTRLGTVKGTPQDSTHDLHGVFAQGLDLLTFSINNLMLIAPVDVILVPGNHASTVETYLAVSLRAFYKATDRVTVDDRPITRKYYSYGNNLIGLTHGELALKKYAEILPYEVKECFATAKHIEILVGDKHIEEAYKTPIFDGSGLTVRRLAALTKTDRWHYNHSFSLSKRRSYVLVYDKLNGIELQYTNHAD